MARPKKFSPAQADALKGDKTKAPLRGAVESEMDIVAVPGFWAETISYTHSLPGIVFCDAKGNQVVVKLAPHGQQQWQALTRK